VRFLFITGNYKPAVNSGGPVNSVSALAEALVGLGHSVTVIALNEDDSRPMNVAVRTVVPVDGVSVIYFERARSYLEKIRQRFTSVARWEAAFFEWCSKQIPSYDCVHLQIGLLQPSHWVARFCQKQGVVLTYHQRGNLDARRFGRFYFLKSLYIQMVEVPVLDRADILFALSAREAEVYRQWTSKGRIEQLPNGVDTDFWGDNLEAERLKPSKEADYLVVWSARWDLRKGPLEFIEMAKILSKQWPKVRFLMMGPERGSDLSTIEAAVADSGLKQLQVFKGLIRESRRSYLQAANLFVLPTYGEGFSVGILEALAAGCAVLTTEAANFPELEDTSFGRIVVNDSQVFADSAAELMSVSADARMSREVAVRDFVKARYAWSKIADRYVEITKSVVNL